MDLTMRWQLDDLYPSFDSPSFTDDLARLKSAVAAIERFAETALSDTTDTTGAAEKIAEYIRLVNGLARYDTLSYYCQLIQSVDASDTRAIKQNDIIDNLLTGLAKPDALFKQFVAKTSGFEAMLLSAPLLTEHAFALREIREAARYALSEKEETIVSMMETTGSTAWGAMKEQLFATLTTSVVLDGTAQILPMTAIRNLAYHPNAETRKAAYTAELNAYERIDKASAAALNAIKGEVVNLSGLRGYSSPLAMTLIDARLEKRTLDAMFAAMVDFFPVFRRYLKSKAALLGHGNGLPFYDLFAPVGQTETAYSYAEARALIIRIFSGFSEKLGAFAQKAFDGRWIDAEIREGKRGGAFCENILPIGQSRIMANFSGTFNDVLTLAHELGHAYHGDCLIGETHLNSQYTMPIAETASTFCETLLCDAMLGSVPPEERIGILEQDISGATQVIVDIYSRFLFEDAVISKRAAGPLSVDELKDLMIAAQTAAYGDGLDPAALHPYLWICKPHYYYSDANYYNFPYAYGQLFSKGLFAKYKREGASFVRQYDAMLAAAGKHTLEDLAALMDIDVTGKDFWVESLKEYEKMVDQFCSMVSLNESDGCGQV